MGIVAEHAEAPPARTQGDALHHQHAIQAQHIDAIAQPVGIIIMIDHDVIAIAERRRHRFAIDANDRYALRPHPQMPQPAGVEGHHAGRPLILVQRAAAGRRAERQARNRHHGRQAAAAHGRRNSRRAAAQHILRHAEITRQHAPIILIQFARRAPFDELLNICGIAPDQAGQIGVIFPAIGDQPFQRGAGVLRLIHSQSITDKIFPRQVGK